MRKQKMSAKGSEEEGHDEEDRREACNPVRHDRIGKPGDERWHGAEQGYINIEIYSVGAILLTGRLPCALLLISFSEDP